MYAFESLGDLGQPATTDAIFFLKEYAKGSDLPWLRPTKLIALDPGIYRSTGTDPLTSTAYNQLYNSLKDANGEVIPNLLRKNGIAPGGRVAFVGFSAALGFLSPMLANDADRARIDSVLLMDACFGGSKPGYQAALRDASEGRMLLVSSTALSEGPLLQAGGACFRESVLKPTGLPTEPTTVLPPAPEPAGGADRIGLLGFWNRNEQLVHQKIPTLTLPVMQAYLLPRFRGELQVWNFDDFWSSTGREWSWICRSGVVRARDYVPVYAESPRDSLARNCPSRVPSQVARYVGRQSYAWKPTGSGRGDWTVQSFSYDQPS